MTGDEATEQRSGWTLGSWTQTEEGPAISLLREVTEQEHRSLQEAAEFIRTAAGGAGYVNVIRAIEDFEQRAADLASESPVEAHALEHSLRVVARLVVACAERVIASIDDSPLVVGADRQLLQAELRQMRDASVAISTCAGLLERSPLLTVVRTGEKPEVFVVGERKGARYSSPMALLMDAANELQRMLAQRLVVLSPLIAEASLMLRRVTAEVLDGAPALIRPEKLNGGDGSATTSLGLNDLALPLIAPLQRQLQRAERLLSQPGPTDDRAKADEIEEPSLAPDWQPASDPEGSPEGATEANEQPGALPSGVLDLRLVVERLAAINDTLERAWSEALDAVDLDTAHQDLRADFESLLRALGHATSAEETRMRAKGVDPVLAAGLRNLTVDAIVRAPNTRQMWEQLQVAMLHAISIFGEALAALARHANAEIAVDDQGRETVATWWESGAFDTVRRAARFVLRIYEEKEAAERELLAEAGATETDSEARMAPDQRSELLERFMLGQMALAAGDPEAALLHTRLAYRALFVVADDGEEGMLERMEADPVQAEVSRAARAVTELAQRLAAGDRIDLGTVTLVVLVGLNQLAAGAGIGAVASSGPAEGVPSG